MISCFSCFLCWASHAWLELNNLCSSLPVAAILIKVIFYVLNKDCDYRATMVLINCLNSSSQERFYSGLFSPIKYVSSLCLSTFSNYKFLGGILMLRLLEKMGTHWNILLFGFLEVILVSWVYGVKRFVSDIKQMGVKMPKFLWWVPEKLPKPQSHCHHSKYGEQVTILSNHLNSWCNSFLSSIYYRLLIHNRLGLVK